MPLGMSLTGGRPLTARWRRPTAGTSILVGVCLAAVGGRGDSVRIPQVSDETGVVAARMELLVLRASLPQSVLVERNRTVTLPSHRVLSDDETAELLARMAKPIYCTATADPSGALVNTCHEFDDNLVQAHDLYVRSWEDEWETESGFKSHIGDRGVLLVYGRGRAESLLLSSAALKRWYQDYHPPPSMGYGGRPPDSTERANGADYVMGIWRIEPIDERTLAPYIQRILKPLQEGGGPPHRE